MGLHSVTCHPAEVTFSTLLVVGNKSSKCKKAINKSRNVQNFLTVSNFSKKLLSVLPTSLCPASSVHSAVKMTLPAFAARRRCCWASVAVALLPAQSSAANPPNALLGSNDGTDGRIDGHATVT